MWYQRPFAYEELKVRKIQLLSYKCIQCAYITNSQGGNLGRIYNAEETSRTVVSIQIHITGDNEAVHDHPDKLRNFDKSKCELQCSGLIPLPSDHI